MLISENRKYIFDISGIVIILFWIVMMGLLIKKENFYTPRQNIDYKTESISIETAQREWKEIFLNDKKVGYSVSIINPFEDGYFIQEEMFLKLNLMGMERNIYSSTQSMVNKEFRLESFHFKMTSGIVRFTVSGKVEGNQLHLASGAGKDTKTWDIALSDEPMIGAGLGHYFKKKKIRVGDTYKFPVFDPSTMAQQITVIKVLARENITINNIQYDAFHLEADIWGGRMEFWVDETGATLKEEGFMGLSTVKSSAANAPHNFDVQDGEDFYEAVAVSMDRVLPEPEKLTYLEVRLKGVENTSRLKEGFKGGRQDFEKGVIKIKKEQISDFIRGEILPYESYSPELKRYLDPEYNIESDRKEIKEIAVRLTKDSKSPLSEVRRLTNWVFENLDKKPVVSIPSALEVLRSRVGDCNEHATLLTALLRASGIPSRIAVGLVYTRNRFFYHAWNEAFIGDEWISIDATLNQVPADVGHIRLMHGNLERQVELTGLMGKMELELITYRK